MRNPMGVAGLEDAPIWREGTQEDDAAAAAHCGARVLGRMCLLMHASKAACWGCVMSLSRPAKGLPPSRQPACIPLLQFLQCRTIIRYSLTHRVVRSSNTHARVQRASVEPREGTAYVRANPSNPLHPPFPSTTIDSLDIMGIV